MIDWAELTLFLYVLARMSGFVLFNPILGRRNIPGFFRSGMALVFAVFVFSVTEGQAALPTGLIDLALRMVLEMGLGYLAGTIVSFVFYIPQLAGSVVDTQMGMTMNQIYDAGSQANMSVTGTLLNALMLLLFFAANGHHTLIRIFMTSEQMIPYGQAALTAQAASAMLEIFIECTVLGLKLCMPVLAAELIAQLGMGVLMKVIPQINVFAINVELKVIIGLGLLFLLIAPFSEFLLEAESAMLDHISRVLAYSG